MQNRENMRILSLLPQKGYLPSAILAEEMGCSSRTVRNRIKEINDILEEIADVEAEIISKPRFGFQLCIRNDMTKEQVCASLNVEQQEDVPTTPGERTNYLLMYLLNQNEYTTVSQLADRLYVTEGVVKTALKNTESILQQYGIRISRRPGYGILAIGEETQIRSCIVDFMSEEKMTLFPYGDGEKELDKLASLVWNLLQENEIKITEIEFQNFLKYIYVSVNRNLMGDMVSFSSENQVCVDKSTKHFICQLSEKIEFLYSVKLGKNEKEYLGILLAGKRVIGSNVGNNLVVSAELNELVERMLDSIYDGFHLDLKDNFDLCMLLKQHMVPLDIRLKYQTPLVNPILDEIQKNYPFAYIVAERASLILQENYGSPVPADEIGYLAVIFELAIEKRKTLTKKSNILIVCSSGKGSSNLLMYKYQEEFGEYLNNIKVCNLLEVKDINFDNIDYVFTTVPICYPIPVPVYEVGVFLNTKDIVNVRQILRKGKSSAFKNYFREDLFFTDIHASTKEEVVRIMCERSADVLGITDNIVDSVLYREVLSSTDYGNKVAIPHSYYPLTEETVVSLAILDHEISWGRSEVQVVFLFLIGKKEDQYLQKFYQEIMKLLMDEKIIEEIIQTKNFYILLEQL